MEYNIDRKKKEVEYKQETKWYGVGSKAAANSIAVCVCVCVWEEREKKKKRKRIGWEKTVEKVQKKVNSNGRRGQCQQIPIAFRLYSVLTQSSRRNSNRVTILTRKKEKRKTEEKSAAAEVE